MPATLILTFSLILFPEACKQKPWRNRKTNTMGNKLRCFQKIIPAAMLLAGLNTGWATLTTDDCITGTGCIRTPDGKTGTFQLTANWDVDTMTMSGQVTYTDANFNVSSSQ